AFWWLQRQAEHRRAVEAEIDEAAVRQTAGDWAGAREALDRARFRLGADTHGPLAQRIEAAQQNLNMVALLDGIRLQAARRGGGNYVHSEALAASDRAFRRHGLPVSGEAPAVLADRIRASPIREPLISGLDYWFQLEKDAAGRAPLLAVLRLADDDPFRRE